MAVARVVTVNARQNPDVLEDHTGPLDTHGQALVDPHAMMVRRLTPRECERLQGLPDDHTLVAYRGKTMADGPRYAMIGNGIAINCLAWIGQRIALFMKVTA